MLTQESWKWYDTCYYAFRRHRLFRHPGRPCRQLPQCLHRPSARRPVHRPPPSHCSACGRRLAIRDLVPVFSYLLLRGRCRYCGTRLPVRLALVELGTGVLFGYLFWHFARAGLTGGTLVPADAGIDLLLMLVWSSVFIVLS